MCEQWMHDLVLVSAVDGMFKKVEDEMRWEAVDGMAWDAVVAMACEAGL